jgi:hypothetical protein
MLIRTPYGRRHAAEEDAEDPGAGGRILIPGAHPGYITLEQYESNRARLVANRNSFAGTRYKGSAREGMSLLQGIVLCGRCGRHMNVRYERNGCVQYSCRSQRTRRACQMSGPPRRTLVEQVMLEALARAA